MNYEYQILKAPGLLLGRQLDEVARDGWLLVAVVKEEDMFYYYLERQT